MAVACRPAAFATKFTDNFERDTGHPKAYFEQLAQNHNGDIQRRDLKLTKELKTIVNSAMLAPDPNTQRWVAAQPGAKIAVKQEGMYRVTRAELQNAGFNVNANSANWRLFQEGNEQAIIVGPGDQYIDFYGRSLDAVESDTRMYYLIADTTAGKRIDTRVLRNLGGPVTSNSYTAAAVRKERTQYISTVLNGDAENYWGTLISDTPAVVPDPNPPGYVPFILSDIDTASLNASITIRLQGLFRGNHHVHATFNGHELGFLDFTDQQSASATFYIPTSFLIEGPNFFEFTADPGGDYSLFDTATVNYSRRYVAENDRLAFFTPGYRKADVRNFTSANVRVFDTTYDGNTQLLINFPIVQNGGTFMARLPSDRPAVMYAVADSAMLQSTSVTFNNPSTLSSTTNAADLVIISYSAPDFMAAAETWANYRRSAGGGSFSVKVVDVADVYDEFNYGVPSANSITGFLDYAKNYWQDPGPRYVLLLGDGSYDPRNYEGRGNWDLIPVKMVDLIFGESGSDEALPDFDHDGTANIPIGRIPARAMTDITTSLNKTMTSASADMVRAFLNDLEQNRHCKVTTRNQRLAALHAFAHFVALHSPEHIEWCGQIRGIPFKKTAREPAHYLRKPEMDTLLNAPNRMTQQGIRDHALLLFLYNSGARADEAAQLKVSNLQLAQAPDRDYSSVRLRGKGGKLRICPLWPQTVQTITPLISGRSDAERVFLNRCHRPMTRFGIHTMVKRYAGTSLGDKRGTPLNPPFDSDASTTIRGRHQYDPRLARSRVNRHNKHLR